MAARVFGVRWGFDERLPARLRRDAEAACPDGRDRSPEMEALLGGPGEDGRVGHGEGHQRHDTCADPQVGLARLRRKQPDRKAMEVALRVLLGPEHRRIRLRRRAALRFERAYIAYLGDCVAVYAASQRWWRWQRRRLIEREREGLIAPDLGDQEERRGRLPNARFAA